MPERVKLGVKLILFKCSFTQIVQKLPFTVRLNRSKRKERIMNEFIETTCEDLKDSIDDILKEFKRINREIHKIKIKLNLYSEEDIKG